jgi:uncharacterized protein (TIGR04255 family)
MFNYPGNPQASYMMDNPPVVRVVVQVAYPPAARLGTPEGVAELQERLSGSFQLQQQQPSMGLHISFGMAPGVVPGSSAVFAHPDGYELTIGPDSLALAIDQRYRDRTHFAAVLEPVLTTVAAAGRIRDYARIGVRYINAAPATVEQFRAWFKPEYVGWAGGDVVAGDANRTWVLITQVLRTDAASPVTNGVIRYGFLQNGVGADITNSDAANAPSFIADIDLGDQRPGPFESATLSDKFRAINHEIAAFFENSMTTEGIAHFAIRPKET